MNKSLNLPSWKSVKSTLQSAGYAVSLASILAFTSCGKVTQKDIDKQEVKNTADKTEYRTTKQEYDDYMSNGYQRQVKYYQTTKAAFDAKPQDTPEKAQKLEELERAIKAMKGANTTKEQYEKKLRKLRKKIPEGEKKKSTLVIAFETEKAKRDAEEKNGTGSVTIQEAISFPDL